jgi:hypothetical protein
MIRAGILLCAAATVRAYSAGCVFCTYNSQGQAVTFDLSTLSNATYEATPQLNNPFGESYSVTQPCGQAISATCGWQNDPMLQSCNGVGNLANISIAMSDPSVGFNLTLHGGFDVPPMPNGRNAVYHFVCDTTGKRAGCRCDYVAAVPPPTAACPTPFTHAPRTRTMRSARKQPTGR